MSTIKSSDEHLTLNADGSSKDIKFQANGVEKASISSSGAFTSTTIDATVLTGNLPALNASALTNLDAADVSGTHTNFRSTGIDDNSTGNYIGIDGEGALSLYHDNTNHSSGDKWLYLRHNGVEIGSISQSGTTATAFNTSSDYRLKENIDYTWDATTRLKQLKPARFNFISDDTNTLVDGFIAHEVSSIVPEAITGEKDAVNEDGDIQPQGIDQSKLVPLLVKTIQELEARIAALEA